MGDEKISSEMYTFCELSKMMSLEPLVAMSKDELNVLNGNCKKAITYIILVPCIASPS